MPSISTYGWVLATVACPLLACAPPASKGQCIDDSECTGRGQVCNVEDALCETVPFDPESTRDGAPATFSDEPMPFFRGRICTVTSVQTGSAIPITLSPCVHPCLDAGTKKFHKSYRCTNGSCTGWVALWMNVDSVAPGCPENPFGRFDREQCVWDETVSLTMNVEVGGEPVVGSLSLEVPYLSNDDIRELPADPSTEQIQTAIDAYPQLDDRVVGPISLRDDHPAPPTTCEGSTDCECFEIGF